MCGLIGFYAANLTRSDGRKKVRLKVLPNKPRDSAWPPSVRAVKCPVKSGNEQDLHPHLPSHHFWGVGTMWRLLEKLRGRCRQR